MLVPTRQHPLGRGPEELGVQNDYWQMQLAFVTSHLGTGKMGACMEQSWQQRWTPTCKDDLSPATSESPASQQPRPTLAVPNRVLLLQTPMICLAARWTHSAPSILEGQRFILKSTET